MSETEQSTGKQADRDDDVARQETDDASAAQADVESKESAEDSEETTDRSDTSDDSADGASDSEEGGTRQPGADPEDKEEIEEERERRLDPENRPDNVEVDNTDRDFDVEKGMFTDNEDYDQAEPKFPGMGEQGA